MGILIIRRGPLIINRHGFLSPFSFSLVIFGLGFVEDFDGKGGPNFLVSSRFESSILEKIAYFRLQTLSFTVLPFQTSTS